MNMATFLGLVQNASLLLAIAILFDVTALNWHKGQASLWQVPVGIILGGAGIAVMLSPWTYIPGIVFDTRSVLLGIAGLFFGFVPTAIAMVITALFRLSQGGAAAVTGVCVIVATGSIGIAWRHFRRRSLSSISIRELYVFGLILHGVMLALMFILPWQTALQVLANITLPVIIIYPAGTALLGALMVNHLNREQTSEALRESDERLHLAVNAANIGFFVRNLITNQEYHSPEWKKQIGYAEDESLGHFDDWQSRVHPDDLQPAIARENACIQNLNPNYESEFRLRHRDGSYRWILARGLLQYNASGKAVNMLGCHIDITTRKQNEAAILASERRFRSLAESSQDYIMLYDRAGRHVYMNPAGLLVSNFSTDDIFGKTHRQAGFTEELSAMWEEDIERVFTQATSSQRLFEWQSANGNMHLDWRLSPVLGLDGSVELVLGISRDITELKRTEQKVQAANAELERLLGVADRSRQVLLAMMEEQKRSEEQIRQLNTELELRVAERTAQLEAANKELEAFSYSVSHDLRAPLRAMDGFSAALLDSYSNTLDAQGQHYLVRIQAASQRMGRLINDLLSLSRVTRAEINRRRVNLSELAQEIVGELANQYPDRRVSCDISPNLIVQGDAHLLRIMLENLLNNAYKFTADRQDAHIRVGLQEQDGGFTYFISDNGVGFDMTYASKLFAPFQRLHGTREFPGTGIGLVTVKRIINRHGGQIWPEAAVDRGATFYFTLGGSDERENHPAG